MNFLHNNFVLVCTIFCMKKSVKLLWICVPRALFSYQKPDTIYLVVMILGFMVVLFYYEVSDDSATGPLS